MHVDSFCILVNHCLLHQQFSTYRPRFVSFDSGYSTINILLKLYCGQKLWKQKKNCIKIHFTTYYIPFGRPYLLRESKLSHFIFVDLNDFITNIFLRTVTYWLFCLYILYWLVKSINQSSYTMYIDLVHFYIFSFSYRVILLLYNKFSVIWIFNF